jgi:hypothetical protein
MSPAILSDDLALDVIARLRRQRDHWLRLFSRLEAAIETHRRAAEGPVMETWDEALYAAHDEVMREAIWSA